MAQFIIKWDRTEARLSRTARLAAIAIDPFEIEPTIEETVAALEEALVFTKAAGLGNVKMVHLNDKADETA